MSVPFSYVSLGASKHKPCSRSIYPALPSQKCKVSYWVPSPDFGSRSHSSKAQGSNILLNSVLYECPTASQSGLSSSQVSQQPATHSHCPSCCLVPSCVLLFRQYICTHILAPRPNLLPCHGTLTFLTHLPAAPPSQTLPDALPFRTLAPCILILLHTEPPLGKAFHCQLFPTRPPAHLRLYSSRSLFTLASTL